MEDFSVEDLNPRGQTCKTMEMAIKRGRVLRRLCREALEAADGDPRYARTLTPWHSGFGAKRADVIEVFGEPVYEAERTWASWWPWLWDAWYDGSLDRDEEIFLSHLPSSVRQKLTKET